MKRTGRQGLLDTGRRKPRVFCKFAWVQANRLLRLICLWQASNELMNPGCSKRKYLVELTSQNKVAIWSLVTLISLELLLVSNGKWCGCAINNWGANRLHDLFILIRRTPMSAKKSQPSTKKSAEASRITVTPEQRDQMIAEAAYYQAERRHFEGGDPIQDWLAAETEICSFLQHT